MRLNNQLKVMDLEIIQRTIIILIRKCIKYRLERQYHKINRESYKILILSCE